MCEVTGMDYEKLERRTRLRDRSRKTLVYALLVFWAVLVLFPFYWMLLTSVKSYGAYNSEWVPKLYTTAPTLENYGTAFTAVPLGGCAADYYPFRRYNFGTGTSIRYRFQFTLNRRFSIGNDFYFMRLFILKGKTPEKLALYTSDEHRYKKEMEDGINAWGDKGEQSIFQNRLYFQCHFSRNLHLTLQHELNLRHGNYRYYPSITGKSHEWKAGVSYAL